MIGVVMHLYGYELSEWREAVFSQAHVLPSWTLIESHRLALKYDLSQLAAAVSGSLDRWINQLLQSRSHKPTATFSDQVLSVVKALYGTLDNERSPSIPGFLRAMRTHWANLIDVRKDAITAVFKEHPRLALDLLMSDPKHVQWSA